MKRVYLLTCLLLLVLLPVIVSADPPGGTLSAYGNISVTSVPAGATIYLNGTSTGQVTPSTVESVPVGSNTLLIRLTGYQDYSTPVIVIAGTTSAVSQTLTAIIPAPTITSVLPAYGYNTSSVSNIVITGTGFSTSGATVVLAKSGQTNITGSITAASTTQLTCTFDITNKPAGNWDVIVTNADGQAVTRTSGFEIRSSVSTVTLSSIAPSSALTNTTVSITSLIGTNFQDSATISLRRTSYNDIFGTVSTLTSTKITGTFDLTNKVPGDYQVCVINPSSDAVCGLTFTIDSPSTVTNGSIYFETNPSGASVYVNNTLKGTTALTLSKVPPGSYKVLIQMSGYQSYTETVKVTSGTKSTVYAKLVASETATATTAPPVTTSPTAVKTTKKSTITTPTPWPTATATPASPLGTLAIIGAVCLAFITLRKH